MFNFHPFLSFFALLPFLSFHGRSFGTMSASPLQIEFLGEIYTFDINHMNPVAITPKYDFDFDIPSTTKMDLGKPLPPVPFQSHPSSTREVLQDVTRRMASNHLERRPSELSCSSMITDSFSSTTSDTYLEDRFSYEHRNCESSDLLVFNSPPKLNGIIYQSDSNWSSPNLSGPRKNRSQTILAFPPPPPPPPPPIPQQHVSWPGHTTKPAARPNRPRANTTPTRPPSNLSTCTTLNFRSSSNESSPVYMKFPGTPSFAPSSTVLPSQEIENETSYFDFDDDDESPRAKLAKVFRRHGSSPSTGTSTPERDLKGSLTDRPKRKFRKRISDANQSIKEVFGIKTQ